LNYNGYTCYLLFLYNKSKILKYIYIENNFIIFQDLFYELKKNHRRKSSNTNLTQSIQIWKIIVIWLWCYLLSFQSSSIKTLELWLKETYKFNQSIVHRSRINTINTNKLIKYDWITILMPSFLYVPVKAIELWFN
jgi:hypothetical protein